MFVKNPPANPMRSTAITEAPFRGRCNSRTNTRQPGSANENVRFSDYGKCFCVLDC